MAVANTLAYYYTSTKSYITKGTRAVARKEILE